MTRLGIFGKLPAHGDFIDRNLSGEFIQVWDEWMQCILSGSKERLGDGWLDYYLTSRIWRFALKPGVVDGQSWFGVVVPSVDSVGRYFPLTMTVPVEGNLNTNNVISDNDGWFSALEALAISALNSQYTVDEILTNSSDIHIVLRDSPVKIHKAINGSINIYGGNFADQVMMVGADSMDSLGAYSIWMASGEDKQGSCTLIKTGLPSPDDYVDMICGN